MEDQEVDLALLREASLPEQERRTVYAGGR